MPRLVLTEKPSVARSIADALGPATKHDGYLETREYVITWAFGHLVELGRPEDYDERYKRWTLEELPIIPSEWRLFPRDKTSVKQLKVIAGLAKRCDEVVMACDAGREGELIGRQILQYLGINLPMQRLWISSMTREAILEGFRNLRPGSDFDNLYASAELRARGDWLVGMNASRAFTLRFSDPDEGPLSVGRVQTPTLAILVRREQEIRDFKPEDYYLVRVVLSAGGTAFQALWMGESGPRIRDRSEAERLCQVIADAGLAVVREAKVADELDYPPQLWDLTSLQREANRRYGLTAQQTLDAAQSLYEEKKLITYPRTDSRYLTHDLMKQIPRILANVLSQPDYEQFQDKCDPKYMKRRAVFNDAKVTDHHAIIPTHVKPSAPLDGAEKKVYDLIVRRFLANTLPPAVDHVVRLVLDAGGEQLVASGTQEVTPGWRVVEPPSEPRKGKGRTADTEGVDPDDEVASGPVPGLEEGETAFVDGAELVRRTTKPPRRFTEGALLGAMEHAGRDIGDEELQDAIKGRGLGTPATRAAIIERLKEVGYVVNRGRALVPTPKGERLVELVTKVGLEKLASPELTADWELRLYRVAEGTEDPARLLRDLEDYAREVVRVVADSEAEAGPPVSMAANLPPCPVCGSPVVWDRYTVHCSREGCTLRINRSILGRELASEDIVDLLLEGRTVLLGGFVSRKTNRPFAAALVLKKDGSGVEFDFTVQGTPKAPPRGRFARYAGAWRRDAGTGHPQRTGKPGRVAKGRRALLMSGTSERTER